MKQGIKYSFLLGLTLPFNLALAVEEPNNESVLQSLDAITSQVDGAPALLLLTPSQIDAVTPPKEKAVSRQAKNQLAKPKAESAASIRELKALQVKNNQLSVSLAQQAAELKQLRQSVKTDADARGEVERLKQALQESLQSTDKMQQQLAAATTLQTTKQQDNVRLQQDLDRSLQQSSTLQKQLDTLVRAQAEKAKENQQIAEKSQQQIASLTTNANEKEQKNKTLQQDLAKLKKEQADAKAAIVIPKTEAEIRDYAIGSSLGNDMLALLKEKAAQGVQVDNQLALAGVQDAFAGQFKVAQAAISKALYETEVAMNAKEAKIKSQEELTGSRYIDQFKKNKQVKKAESGFYYRVDYLGVGKINPADTVAVVVKESLTNGKVIKDMDVAGTSVSQPLNSYPPMFQEAIAQLQNHGSMTMVVPPSLAYGDKGLPPDIPPGATMVYNLRILDILPADKSANK